MFRTLGLLAISMTACALLLSWLERSRPATPIQSKVDQLALEARQALLHAPPDALRNRRHIEILLNAVTGSAVPLTGTRDTRHHFLVPENGVVGNGNAWRRATPPSSLVIGLTHTGRQNDLPVLQWLSLRALLAALAEHLHVNETDLPLFVHADAAGGAGAAQVLRDLLAQNGFRVSGAPAKIGH